jgi:hypothetical protein
VDVRYRHCQDTCNSLPPWCQSFFSRASLSASDETGGSVPCSQQPVLSYSDSKFQQYTPSYACVSKLASSILFAYHHSHDSYMISNCTLHNGCRWYYLYSYTVTVLDIMAVGNIICTRHDGCG